MTAAADWTGSVGDIWAAEWRRTDRSFADLSRHLDAAILAAAPDGPFRALDIGCGAGGTSLALADARLDAPILGVDLSAGLVEVARERFAAVEGGGTLLRDVHFKTGDAPAAAAAHGPFDLLYSRHGVMFFHDPAAAFTALHTTAAPGARLVFSCFAAWSENGFAKSIADALDLPPPTPRAPGPFAFAEPDYVADLLIGARWTRPVATRIPFIYRAGEGRGDAAVADALSFFQRIGPAAGPLRAAKPADRPVMLDRLTAVLRAHRVGNAIDFPALAWIWSATA